MAIINTSKEPREHWLMGGNSRAIEDQEAGGQQQLVASSQLPAQTSKHGESSISMLQKLGVEVLGQTVGDELFFDVRLPVGWKIEATDHSMWSELKNADGKRVAEIFYKAAFYDRRAHIDPYPRP